MFPTVKTITIKLMIGWENNQSSFTFHFIMAQFGGLFLSPYNRETTYTLSLPL